MLLLRGKAITTASSGPPPRVRSFFPSWLLRTGMATPADWLRRPGLPAAPTYGSPRALVSMVLTSGFTSGCTSGKTFGSNNQTSARAVVTTPMGTSIHDHGGRFWSLTLERWRSAAYCLLEALWTLPTQGSQPLDHESSPVPEDGARPVGR